MNSLKTEYDWNFDTEKCQIYKGMEGGIYSLPQGCMLGGSSSLNAMIYLRGTKFDFDLWRKNGCHGWGYKDVLPYFKKSEDFVDCSGFDVKIHSRGGPLTVSSLETSDPAYKIIAKAERSLNLCRVNDLNEKKPFSGYGNFDSTTRDGRRCSTLKAFLLPACNRTNLYVAKNTLVTRIVFREKTAVGVEFLCPRDGSIKFVFCSKEVILSAGPINSPKILMISGVGPKEHLEELNIPVVNDLPVGCHLQDHMSFPAIVFSDRKCNRTREQIRKESEHLLQKEASYILSNITSMGISELMTFINTKDTLKYPNIQIIIFRIPYKLIDATPNSQNIMSNLFSYSSEVGELFKNLNSLTDLIIMIPIILQPKSTGRVMLRSNNPRDSPKIFADLLTDEEDRNTLIEGIEFVLKLAKTREMVDGGFVLEDLKLSQCDHFQWGSREYWNCALDYLAAPFFHAACTCKMGPENDPCAVVDPTLKVQGTECLRVIDSSVMYKIVSANTNAASIMIGEKGSCMIKEYYEYPGT